MTTETDALLVAVSIGNTSLGLGVAGPHDGPPDPWHALHTCATENFDADWLNHVVPQAVRACYVSSVHRPTAAFLTDWFAARAIACHTLRAEDLDLPIRVASPERVGMDRLAAAVAANQLRHPEQAAILVDAGTAITVDLVDPHGCFQGGAILPGLRMSAEALAARTDLLPLVDVRQPEAPDVLGKSTEAAIRSGVCWGAVGAVREVATRLAAPFERPPACYVTGGDAPQLLPHLQLPMNLQLVPHLVLAGVLQTARSLEQQRA